MGETTWKDIKHIACMMLAIFILIGSFTGIRGCIKADAYERVTGKRVSVWDATWLDLRVQEPASDQVKPTTKKE